MTGLETVSKIYGGNLEGGYVDSSSIYFDGGTCFNKGKYVADIKTAGSICLIIQVVLPCLVFGRGGTEIILKGGTNAIMAPQVDYFMYIFKPIIKKFGIECNLELKKRGFYPIGKGEAVLTCEPVKTLKPIEILDQGKLSEIKIISFVSGVLQKSDADLAANTALSILKAKYPNVNYIVESFKEPPKRAVGTGSGIVYDFIS